MSSGDDGLFKGGAALVFFGATFMHQGLKELKLRRRIRDIPTSKIDSAAIGSFVEVKGNIVASSSERVISPFSHFDCACFTWVLQREVRTRNGRYWRDYRFFHSHHYLILNDGGQSNLAIKVEDIESSHREYSKTVEFTSRTYDLPEGVKEILRKEKILDTDKKDGFLFSSRYRLREVSYLPGTSLFVLGSLSSWDKTKEKKQYKRNTPQKILNKFQKLIQRPSIIARYDKNADGRLSIDEQKAIIKHLGDDYSHFLGELEEQEKLKIKGIFQRNKLALKFFDTEKVYVSTHKEEDLISKMGSKSKLKILAGPIMFALGIYFLVLAFSF